MFALAALLTATVVEAHPLHTSHTEVVVERDRQSVTVTVRVFTDDFTAAAGAGDSAAAAYLRERLVLTDRAGGRVTLHWRGHESRRDALIIRLSGHAPSGLGGARNTILCERFADQVNIVRVSEGFHAATLLFTRGSGTETLP